ncbi:Hypothetical predicted protein [Lecanosticta acicola]|uniref:Coenzyme Q-binding protein COQ10 START domain-containing protein n=1 Tax=Lecanosticta acicola TaxID=111012 RepID=A0AAI8Z3P8_9PEZI|nr:Hypothetical predicted protein [Lecanosticta acicola]
MASFLSAPSTRRLSHTSTIPYSPNVTFAALTDISSYHQATSLIHSSSTTARDAQNNNLPKTAKLHIGYPPLGLTETWNCSVKCNKREGTIEIKREGESSVLEKSEMRWAVVPAEGGRASQLRVELQVKFKSAMVDSMFYMMEGYVAQTTLERFTGLVKARDEKEKKEAAAAALKKKAAPPPVAIKRVPKKLEVRSPPGAASGKQKSPAV